MLTPNFRSAARTVRSVLSILTLVGIVGRPSLAAGAIIVRHGSEWVLRTSKVERTISLEHGNLLCTNFRDVISGRELLPRGVTSSEFSAGVGVAGSRVDGDSGGWELVRSHESAGKAGERQLDLTVRRDSLQVTRSYVIYPGSSIIREWTTFMNTGKTPLRLFEPDFLDLAFRAGAPDRLDFNWMTGGENRPGSWVMKTESLPVSKPRAFDSNEPFPGAQQFPGDGIRAKILLNDRQVWPAKGEWQYVANATVTAPFSFDADVTKGDRLVFLVNMNQNIGFDTTAFDPTITFSSGESHTASKEFSATQGFNGWKYQYVENGKFVNLVYYPEHQQWRKKIDNVTGTPFIGPGSQHPDAGQDSARVWLAPHAGRVHVSGSITNTGNGSPAAGPGFRPGTSSYAPWYSLYGRDTHEGVVIGWDYFGHWSSSFQAGPRGAVTARLRVAGCRAVLGPGQSLTTPKAFVGLYTDDLDNAGNEVLNWQYRYLWDYTRKGWFPAIRMLGYWYNGTSWNKPGNAWFGGGPDYLSTYRKVFGIADLMREVGADVYHRDWGWWDRAGDWNGPDFRRANEYLRKYDMGMLIYAFVYNADPSSKVGKTHPDWLIGGSIVDLSKPEVIRFIESQLDEFYKRWGNFEWRNDSTFTAPRGGDETAVLLQDQGFRTVLKTFLDRHPGCAFQGVNGGGNYAGYDYARYASTLSFSDGAVGPVRNYYASLLLPPDKTSDIPDIYNPDRYDKESWRGLLCINFDMTGDTRDPARIEGVRQLIDIYHYLQGQGVVGRWVQVYRPIVTGDDPTMYFQRLSGDHRRGIIIPKHRAPGTVNIKPKGLLPSATYTVSFQESPALSRRSGADLMKQGITLDPMAPGDLIYLNLPLHPGSRLDRIPPAAPRGASKRKARNMGFPGVEIAWEPGTDNNWVSGYEIDRNGVLIDRIGREAFYFDHSAGADLAAVYSIRTVDGAGNLSTPSIARGAPAQPARIIDDAPGDGFEMSGSWRRVTGIQPAYAGSLSSSEDAGASAVLQFSGKRITWFTKLGPNGGIAKVSIDGGIPVSVDTYDADEIWGAGIYERALSDKGPHTLRILVTGSHNPRSGGSTVYLDGVRVEPD